MCGEGVGECMGWVGKCVGVWGREWGRCREMYWGMAPQHTFNSPYLLPTSPFPAFPLTSPTPHHTFLHLPLIPLPTSPLSPPTPQHIFLLSLHHPSLFQGVAKLPSDEVSVAKLPCGKVTGNRLEVPCRSLWCFQLPCNSYKSTL